jgi:hypothetical protein
MDYRVHIIAQPVYRKEAIQLWQHASLYGLLKEVVHQMLIGCISGR